MQREACRGTIDPTKLTQFVTLKLSLIYLFDDADTALGAKDTFDDVIYIGHRINDLWVSSKKSSEERLHWVDELKLHKALRRVTIATAPTPPTPPHMPGNFPNETEPINTEENPLNFLLPAFSLRSLLLDFYSFSPSPALSPSCLLEASNLR